MEDQHDEHVKDQFHAQQDSLWEANHPTPDQCYECHRYHNEGDQPFAQVEVDADPGDPEVGPQPDIITVSMCMSCVRKNTLMQIQHAKVGDMIDPNSLPEKIRSAGGGWVENRYVCIGAHKDGTTGWKLLEIRVR